MIGIRSVRTTDRFFQTIMTRLLNRGETMEKGVEKSVKRILGDVRLRGDKALIGYTQRLDKVTLTPSTIRVPQEMLKEAYRQVKTTDLRALKTAARNIRSFYRRQRIDSWAFRKNGILLGQRVLPMERVGIYVPGGKAVYPSTVLMNAIPARVAGVPHIVMCTPPVAKGGLHPALLVAADLAGIEEIYRVGGAQAIGAMAYGTPTIRRVDKVVGPGNVYVATAKKLVYGRVGIDFIAGPSEIVIVADREANPSFVAADLLSQAEHDEMAVCVLITPSSIVARRVLAEMDSQCRALPADRQRVIQKSLKDQGAILVTRDVNEALSLANAIAPEHLSLQVHNLDEALSKVSHAGAIFLGPFTPQTLGDYVAGPSHVLPTGGTARFSSPLTVEDFVKRTSIIGFSPEGLRKEGPVAVRLAKAEGLWAHARAITIRMDKNA